jgi:hypothetical protein
MVVESYTTLLSLNITTQAIFAGDYAEAAGSPPHPRQVPGVAPP